MGLLLNTCHNTTPISQKSLFLKYCLMADPTYSQFLYQILLLVQGIKNTSLYTIEISFCVKQRKHLKLNCVKKLIMCPSVSLRH